MTLRALHSFSSRAGTLTRRRACGRRPDSQVPGRVCRGVELDRLYVDVIVRRYEGPTGNPAVLVGTSATFEPLGA
jgi:hypothetical protein